MTQKTKKATFSLTPRVLAALDEAIAANAAPSNSALVERALVKELDELRRQARMTRWEEGARDPLLLRDIAEVESAFRSADSPYSHCQPEGRVVGISTTSATRVDGITTGLARTW